MRINLLHILNLRGSLLPPYQIGNIPALLSHLFNILCSTDIYPEYISNALERGIQYMWMWEKMDSDYSQFLKTKIEYSKIVNFK